MKPTGRSMDTHGKRAPGGAPLFQLGFVIRWMGWFMDKMPAYQRDVYKRQFQSTPPSRVATADGSDDRKNTDDFNPHHPRGWRLRFARTASINADISIHTTLAGGDILKCLGRTNLDHFNPHHPRGWRLDVYKRQTMERPGAYSLIATSRPRSTS